MDGSHLGCPVIPMVATNKQGIQALQAAIIKQQATVRSSSPVQFADPIEKAITCIRSTLSSRLANFGGLAYIFLY